MQCLGNNNNKSYACSTLIVYFPNYLILLLARLVGRKSMDWEGLLFCEMRIMMWVFNEYKLGISEVNSPLSTAWHHEQGPSSLSRRKRLLRRKYSKNLQKKLDFCSLGNSSIFYMKAYSPEWNQWDLVEALKVMSSGNFFSCWDCTMEGIVGP